MIHIEKNTLTAPQFHTLYTAVGWDAPEICQIERALAHSMAVFSAYDDADPSCPVGMVRLLGDGGMSFYLKDFAVLPSYQHNGIGSLLMEAVAETIHAMLEEDWAVSLECISTPDAVPFYERHGFAPRPNEWDGPGMLRMLRKTAEETK